MKLLDKIGGEKMKFFSRSSQYKNEIFTEKRTQYSEWRNELQKINKPFFMIPTDFKHIFLKKISGGALKLFLFLGFHSKYQTGESWYSIEQIANFFEKDKRTISNWFQELEKLGLIYRGQKGYMMKANTFLRPFGFRFDEIDTEESSNLKHIKVNLENSKLIGYKTVLGLIVHYSLKEYTVLLVHQEGNIFHCACFYNFDEKDIKQLKVELNKYNVKIDYYDLDKPINSVENKLNVLYNVLINYLDEQSNLRI
jgi:DNA-binding transcriptional regulator YhcF (GntR family)